MKTTLLSQHHVNQLLTPPPRYCREETNNQNIGLRHYKNSLKWIVMATAILYFSQAQLFAQNCDEVEIFFETTNVLACNDEAVFQLIEASQIPPSTIADVDITTSSGFTYSTASYDPGSGKFTFFDVVVTSYQKFGSFEARVTHGGGSCDIFGKVVECCIGFDPPYLLVVDEDITDQTTVTAFDGTTIIFMGDVFLPNANYRFDDARIYLGPDAQIIADDLTEIEIINNSILRPYCDCRWDRILLEDEDNAISIKSSIISGSLRGINATTELPVFAENSNFIDNVLSIVIENFSGIGPFNDSYLKLDGNSFDVTGAWNIVYCYNSLLSNVDIISVLSNTCASVITSNVVYISVQQSNNVHIGHEDYDKNEFKNTASIGDFIAISSNESQIIIRNNLIDEISHGICTYNEARLFVGGATNQGNTLRSSSVYSEESSILVHRNLFEESNFYYQSPYHISVATGFPAGSEIVENDFNVMGQFKINGSNAFGPVPTNIRIFNNLFFDAHPELLNIHASGSGKLNFHSNYMETSTTKNMMEVTECHGMVFANNHLENLMYYTPIYDPADYNGLILTETRDADITGNYYENFSAGIQLHGDNTSLTTGPGTQFTCNRFVNCYHGFYFDESDVLDQGDAAHATDNCFNYYYSGSFLYAECITGEYLSVSNVDWFIRPTSNCNSGGKPFTSCYCLDEDIDNGTLNFIGSADANTCNIPSSSKYEFEDEIEKALPSISAYPNPALDFVHIVIQSEAFDGYVELYNAFGQVIRVMQNEQNEFDLNLSSLPQGIYYLRTTESYVAISVVK